MPQASFLQKSKEQRPALSPRTPGNSPGKSFFGKYQTIEYGTPPTPPLAAAPRVFPCILHPLPRNPCLKSLISSCPGVLAGRSHVGAVGKHQGRRKEGRAGGRVELPGCL